MVKKLALRQIRVTSGVGTGSTELSAFDAALFDAGIANFNLIILSSVIPKNFEVVEAKPPYNGDRYGDRLYLVLAQKRQSQFGNAACAGLGWVTTLDKPPRGLFVEHCGGSKSYVEDHIRQSLGDMCKYRPEKFGDIKSCVASILCEGHPVCAVAAAVYATEGWR